MCCAEQANSHSTTHDLQRNNAHGGNLSLSQMASSLLLRQTACIETSRLHGASLALTSLLSTVSLFSAPQAMTHLLYIARHTRKCGLNLGVTVHPDLPLHMARRLPPSLHSTLQQSFHQREKEKSLAHIHVQFTSTVRLSQFQH